MGFHRAGGAVRSAESFGTAFPHQARKAIGDRAIAMVDIAPIGRRGGDGFIATLFGEQRSTREQGDDQEQKY